MIARNTRGPRSVRLGIWGSLSATSSASARSDRIMVAVLEPRKDSHEPLRSSHPRCAAQLTSAGAVSERNPAMIPMEKHPRYRTPLLTFMPAHFSPKRALVKNRLNPLIRPSSTGMGTSHCQSSVGRTRAQLLSLCDFHAPPCRGIGRPRLVDSALGVHSENFLRSVGQLCLAHIRALDWEGLHPTALMRQLTR